MNIKGQLSPMPNFKILAVFFEKYSVFKKEGVKVEGYYTAKKWILGAV